jgi:predicted  nucleic acid-binding Zn-ribbon protein
MTTTTQSWEKRLAEVDAEILWLRDRIERTKDDERMLEKTSDMTRAEKRAELADLRDERSRLESALDNLTKEFRELVR